MPSLRRRLVWWLCLSLGLVWLGGGVAVLWTLEHALKASFDQELLREAERVRVDVRRDVLDALTAWSEEQQDDGAVSLRELARLRWEARQAAFVAERARTAQETEPGEGAADESTQPGEPLLYQAWIFETGDLVSVSATLAEPSLPFIEDLALEPRLLDLEDAQGQALRAVGYRFRVTRARAGATAGDARRGAARGEVPRRPFVDLLVARSPAELERTLLAYRGGVAIGGLLIAGVAAAVVFLVLGRGLRPLQRLSREAAAIDVESLGARFDEAGLPSELAPIASRLNELLTRLEEGFERERRFGADLAHELRTPVAELRALAEVARRWPERASPTRDDEALRIADRMQALIESLLALTRWEQGRAQLERTELTLASIVVPALRRIEPRAQERELTIAESGTEGGLLDRTVRGEATVADLVVSNLLENAVRYAPSGSTVHVDWSIEAGVPCLRVANPSADLDPADLDRMFERFWRKDGARSAEGGTGLGLPLARAAAEALGWRLTARLLSCAEAEGTAGAGDRLELALRFG